MENDEKWLDKKISRREFLKKSALVGGAAMMGSGILGAIFNRVFGSQSNLEGKDKISFYGRHQSGITTPIQKHIYFAVLDLRDTKKDEIIELFKNWTEYTEKLMEGKVVGEMTSNHMIPPKDTGEVLDLNPNRLTITFGVSPTFLEKLGLSHKIPNEFKNLPHFPRDQIKDEYSGGDICIQACADDAQVAFHAVRNLVRKGRNTITMKWTQSGFLPSVPEGETPRNLFGFKDGTVNPKVSQDFYDVVWRDDNDWLQDGTYLIIRKIQMHLETWDRTNLQEQENTFGRYKDSGAPFGKTKEFDELDLEKMPVDSHVFLARKAGTKIFRRGFSYADGINDISGQFEAGLLFISFQKDPQQFIQIQNTLGSDDKMNEYITHIGSGIFACFGGFRKGEYIGQKLFE